MNQNDKRIFDKIESIWPNLCKEAMKVNDISTVSYNIWIESLKPVSVEDGVLRVAVSEHNQSMIFFVQKKFQKALEETLRDFGYELKICICGPVAVGKN